MLLSECVKISSAVTPTAGAAGTTAIVGSTLDMAGFDGVLMVCRFGTLSSGAVTSIKAQESSDSGMSGAADLAGSSQTVTQASDGDKTFYIDLFRPAKRYVTLNVSRGTGNAVVSSAHYIQYNASVLPVSQGSNVGGEQWVSPSEGTA